MTVAVSALTSGLVSLAVLPGIEMRAATFDATQTLQIQTDGQSGGSNGSNGSASSQSTISGLSGGDGNTITTTTGNSSDGNSNNGSNDCVIPVSQCSDGQSTCGKPPIFTHVPCDSAECITDPSCSPAGSQQVTVSTINSSSSQAAAGGGSRNGNNNGNDVNNTAANNFEPGGSASSSVKSRVGVIGNALGCFDFVGNWVTDRTQCDPNQQKHFKQVGGSSEASSSMSAASESNQMSMQLDGNDHDLQVKFDKLFHTQPERDNAYAGLVNAVTIGLQHLNTLSQQTLPADAAATVASADNSLKTLLGDLSMGAPTVSETYVKAAQVTAILKATEKALAKVPELAAPKPETLTDPLDKVFTAMPNVFVFIAGQGIGLPQDVVAQYKTASDLYAVEKPLCLKHTDSCAQLSNVIGHLDTMRTEIMQALQSAGRTDLESQIDTLTQ
jgi:hypothetical protein